MARAPLYGPDGGMLDQRYLQQRLTGEDPADRTAGSDGMRPVGDVNRPLNDVGIPMGPTPQPNSPLAGFLTKTEGQTPQQRIGQAYPAFLGGRTPGPGEAESHYGNENGLTGALSSVYGSPEATSYRAANPNVNGPISKGPDVPTSGTVPTPSPTTGPAATGSGTRQISGGDIGNVQGYDANKFADQSVQSLKYRAGRILSDYPTTEAGIRQAMMDPRWKGDPDLSKAQYQGGDKIDFAGVLSDGDHGVPVNLVDVLQAFENGASSHPWQWSDQNFAGGATGGGGGTMTGQYGTDPLAGSSGSILLEQIMAELQATIKGSPSPTQQSLLQQLLGGTSSTPPVVGGRG